MVTPPSLRGAAASDGAFPRWGYLDKFYVNEYMARALVVAMLTSFAALGAWRAGLIPRSGTGLVRMERTLQDPVHPSRFQVIPSIGSRPVPAPAIQVHPRSYSSGAVKVVENVSTPDSDRWEPGGPGGLPGPGDGPADGPSTDVPGDGTVSSALPDFDAHIAVEKEPELVDMRTPGYPEIARDAGIEGEVLVRVLVGSDGNVKDAVVVQSVFGLDEAARDAARTAVFKPALQQGHPVAVWVVVPIEFRLRE
jgi:protein TonB